MGDLSHLGSKPRQIACPNLPQEEHFLDQFVKDIDPTSESRSLNAGAHETHFSVQFNRSDNSSLTTPWSSEKVLAEIDSRVNRYFP